MVNIRWRSWVLKQTLFIAFIAMGGLVLWMTSHLYHLSIQSYKMFSKITYEHRKTLQTEEHVNAALPNAVKNTNFSSYLHKFKYKYFTIKDTRPIAYSSYFIPRENVMNPFSCKYVIKPKNLFDSKPFLVIIICSVHSHTSVRTAIRETWGSVARRNTWPGSDVTLNVKLLFLFGEVREVKSMKYLVRQENKKNNDILQGDFLDSYTNLTLKILMGLHFVAESCPDCQYVLKADEDTFTNVDLLYDFLETLHPSNSVIGHIYKGGFAYRYGKWAVPVEMYPHFHYPYYVSGNTYVLSRQLIECIINKSSYLPYISIEDVFITGIMSIVCNASLIDLEGITWWFQKPPISGDLARGKHISATRISPDFARKTWQELLAIRVQNKIHDF